MALGRPSDMNEPLLPLWAIPKDHRRSAKKYRELLMLGLDLEYFNPRDTPWMTRGLEGAYDIFDDLGRRLEVIIEVGDVVKCDLLAEEPLSADSALVDSFRDNFDWVL
jgi:hypothetical protein